MTVRLQIGFQQILRFVPSFSSIETSVVTSHQQVESQVESPKEFFAKD